MQLFDQRNTPRFRTQTDELLNNVAVGCLYIYFFIEEVFVFVVYFFWGGGGTGGGKRILQVAVEMSGT